MKSLLTTAFVTVLAASTYPGAASAAEAAPSKGNGAVAGNGAPDQGSQGEADRKERRRGGFVVTKGSSSGGGAPKAPVSPVRPTTPKPGAAGGSPTPGTGGLGTSGADAGLPTPVLSGDSGGGDSGGGPRPGPTGNPRTVSLNPFLPTGGSGSPATTGMVTPGGGAPGGAGPSGGPGGDEGGDEGGAAGGATWADGIWVRPFEPPDDPVELVITGSGTDFTATNAEFGEIRVPVIQPLFGNEGSLQVQTHMAPAVNGYDWTYIIHNPTGQSQPLPKLQLGGHRLEPHVQVLGLAHGTEWGDLYWTPGQTTMHSGNPYPRTRFAPVTIARDSNLAMGVALHYPVLEYKHDVIVAVRRNHNYSEWMWQVFLEGEIGPGDTREYTVSTRYTREEDWIHTLEGYRDYFWSMYGSTPHYQQDLTPVRGVVIAGTQNLAPDNPRGFRPAFRPDLYGWAEDVDFTLNIVVNEGFQRAMVWSPSGVYMNNHHLGWPMQIMTEWSGPMVSTASEWDRYADAGITLGFWGGHAGEIVFEWDPAELLELDISNPAHVQIKLQEYVLAEARGAKWIGLDSIRALDTWDAVMWIEYLQELFPDVHFIGEPTCSDILHMHIPMVLANTAVQNPPFLSDYLVPGRETWCWFQHDDPTLAGCYELLGWGLTPLLYISGLTAGQLQPAVEMAQNGWVLWPGDSLPIPSPDTFVGD